MKKVLLNIWYMTKYTFKFSPARYIMEFIDVIWESTVFIDLLFTKLILDELTYGSDFSKFSLYIFLWTIVNIVLLIVRIVEYSFLYEPYSLKLIEKENQFYEAIDSQMDYSRLENGSIQDEKNRMRSNLRLSNYAYNPIGGLIATFVQLVGYIYIIATLHPIIIAFLVIIVILTSRISKKRVKINFDYQKDVAKIERKINYFFSAMISYPFAKEVRINHAADWLISKFHSETDSERRKFVENQKPNFKLDTFDELLTLVETILLYGYCTYSVIKGRITIGDFSVYIAAVTAFFGILLSFVRQIHELKTMSDYIDIFKDYIKKAVPSHLKTGVADVDRTLPVREIEFRNVSFKYPGTDNYVLKNVSVKIRGGERISVVGYNGAGKSTFIKLLCRLYEPTSGCILYNGVDISTLNYDTYRELIAVVFQDFNLYSLSVKENMCLAWNPDLERIEKAMDLSGLSEKIKKLPLGIDTQVGREFDENGVEFSGGESQKLACARAYIKDAPIVVFDEPTASLDPISESKLYTRFSDIIGDKTAIYISHRLASVKICDRVLVFENGEIIESGTHDELTNLGGKYSEMFSKQATYYKQEE